MMYGILIKLLHSHMACWLGRALHSARCLARVVSTEQLACPRPAAPGLVMPRGADSLCAAFGVLPPCAGPFVSCRPQGMTFVPSGQWPYSMGPTMYYQYPGGGAAGAYPQGAVPAHACVCLSSDAGVPIDLGTHFGALGQAV